MLKGDVAGGGRKGRGKGKVGRRAALSAGGHKLCGVGAESSAAVTAYLAVGRGRMAVRGADAAEGTIAVNVILLLMLGC